MFLELLKIYLVGAFGIALIATLGCVFVPLRHLTLKTPAVVFLQFTMILLAVVFILSVWVTGGVTVNIIIGIFFLFYFYLNRHRGYRVRLRALTSSMGIPLVGFTFFFVVKCFSFCNFKYDVPNIPHNDILFYTTIADFIGETGQENLSNFRNVVAPSLFNGLNPYHYFEMWVNLMWSKLLYVNSLWAFSLLTHSLLLMAAALGFYALMDQLLDRRRPVLIILFSLGLVFYSGLSTNLPKLDLIPYNGILLPKLLPIAILVLMFTLFFLAGEWWTAITLLMVLAWTNTAAGPGIYIGIFLFATLRWFLNRNRKEAITMMAGVGLSAIGYIIFLTLFKSHNSHLESGIVSLNTWEGALKTWASQGLLLVVNYGLILIPLVWLFRARAARAGRLADPVVQLLLVLLFIIGGGIAFSGVLHSVVSSQFAYNLYIPVMPVVTVLAVVVIVKKGLVRQAGYLAAAVAFVIFLDVYWTFESTLFSKSTRIGRYSKEYIRTSSEMLRHCSTGLGIFIADSSFLEGSALSELEEYHYPGKFLKGYRSNLYLANYWPDKIRNRNSTLEKLYAQGGVLMEYARGKGSDANMDSARLLFMKEYKPGFLVVQGDEFPSELRAFVGDSAVDSRSNEKFYRLKY